MRKPRASFVFYPQSKHIEVACCCSILHVYLDRHTVASLVKVKVKFALQPAMKAKRGDKCIALFFL